MISRTEFENKLRQALEPLEPDVLKQAMLYSLLAGGKRIRPLLLYAVSGGYGVPEEQADSFALALEMIHTYSLIHDDLPAMDNDDLRRGKPTNHVVYGEAEAILAGDALLTYAFETASAAETVSTAKTVACLHILAQAAGPDGMVLGQSLDIQENTATDWPALQRIHHHKTGCLLSAPLEMAAVLADCEPAVRQTWRDIGFDIGLAFQIQDDLLDVQKSAAELGKSNSDARNQKVTSVTLLGEQKSEDLMLSLYQNSYQRIEKMKGFDSTAVLELLKSIQNRSH